MRAVTNIVLIAIFGLSVGCGARQSRKSTYDESAYLRAALDQCLRDADYWYQFDEPKGLERISACENAYPGVSPSVWKHAPHVRAAMWQFESEVARPLNPFK